MDGKKLGGEFWRDSVKCEDLAWKANSCVTLLEQLQFSIYFFIFSIIFLSHIHHITKSITVKISQIIYHFIHLVGIQIQVKLSLVGSLSKYGTPNFWSAIQSQFNKLSWNQYKQETVDCLNNGIMRNIGLKLSTTFQWKEWLINQKNKKH